MSNRYLTISDYISKTTSPFIDMASPVLVDVPAFLKDELFQQEFTKYMFLHHGSRHISFELIEDEGSYSVLPGWITWLYATHKYTLEGLWGSTQMDYNPIENYRMVETSKDTNSGEDVTTRHAGRQESTQEMGNREDSATSGKRTVTTEHDVSPESRTDYTAESRDITDTNSVTDTQNIGRQTNTLIEGERDDRDTLEHGHVLDRKLERSGNIGVTTSQQMIQSERDIVMFSIFKTVANLIIRSICSLVSTEF